MAHSVKKKKNKIVDQEGYAYIKASFNNIIISITNQNKEVIAWSSAGMKFKGTKKQTPYAAQVTATNCAKIATDKGMKSIKTVYVKGPGRKEVAIRALSLAGLAISTIKDITPIPHNGCRPMKSKKN